MSQYLTDINLTKRIAIHRYGVNQTSWADWCLEHVDVKPGNRILDAGCGNGALWSAFRQKAGQYSRVELLDKSPGMIVAARKNLIDIPGTWKFTVGDATDLPYEPSSFDIVIANHMLYHADPVAVAVAELARVTRTRGRFFATTNGIQHMRQLYEWMMECGLQAATKLRLNAQKFGLENGAEILEQHFRSVTLHRRHDSLAVTDVQPVLDYVLSMRPADTPETRAGLEQLSALLRRELKHHGQIRIDKDSGMFEGTPGLS